MFPFSIVFDWKRKLQYLAAVFVNLGIISSNLHWGWTSPYLPVLLSNTYIFTISREEEFWLVNIPLVFALLGALAAYLLTNAAGRKTMILVASVPFIASWLMIALASSVVPMLIARGISGFVDGLYYVIVPSYVGEIAEPKIRGSLLSICPMCIVLGILLINILGSNLPINISAYISSVFPIVLFVAFVWMPESPYYLLMVGDEDGARKNLQKLRGTQNVEDDLGRMANAIKDEIENRSSLLDLFRLKSNRKALFYCLGLRSVQQFSGTMTLIFYCQTIFKESRGFISPAVAGTIYSCLQVVFSVLSSFLVDKAGRRSLLILSDGCAAVCLLVTAVFLYFKECTDVDVSSIEAVPALVLFAYVIMFSMGMTTIPYVFLGETFPTNIKPKALALMDVHYDVSNLIVNLFFHWSRYTYGMHVPFFAFAGVLIFGIFFIIIFIPETKGKTLEEIQKEFQEDGMMQIRFRKNAIQEHVTTKL